MTKIKRNNIQRHLIEYQLKMVDKTIVDTLSDDKWYFNWTMTTEQFKEFESYAKKLLKKTFKFNNKKTNATFDWFNTNYGLRIKN